MTVTPAPRSTRYRSLDFWRGVACLTVVACHSSIYIVNLHATSPLESVVLSLLRVSWLGVPLFFVISGYCISAASESAIRRGDGAREFFMRRFRRIFPPYWALLFLAAIFVGALTVSGHASLVADDKNSIALLGSLSWPQWLGTLTLTEGWRSQLFGPDGVYFMSHAWSLGYEEQFYAICGLLVVLAPRRFFRGAIVVTLLTALVFFVAAATHSVTRLNGFFLDGRWFMFAAGIAVYYRVNHADRRRKRLIDAVLVLSFVVTVVLMIVRPGSLFHELLFAFLFAALLLPLHRFDRAIDSSRVLAPITGTGVMCYSVYLVHWPICKAMSHLLYNAGVRGTWPTLAIVFPVTFTLSLLAAWIFHRTIELRFMNTQRVPQTDVLAPAAAVAL